MPSSTQQRALEFAQKCEQAGKLVRRIIVEGKRFEVEFQNDERPAAPDDIDWKP